MHGQFDWPADSAMWPLRYSAGTEQGCCSTPLEVAAGADVFFEGAESGDSRGMRTDGRRHRRHHHLHHRRRDRLHH